MSTRATYKFRPVHKGITTETYQGDITFYIHHDGYPEGAANYFTRMDNATVKGDNLAQRFTRGNVNAELTAGHNEHGDTEYQYTIDDKGELIAESIDFSSRVRHVFFAGNYKDFIKKYSKIEDAPINFITDTANTMLDKMHGLCKDKKDISPLMLSIATSIMAKCIAATASAAETHPDTLIDTTTKILKRVCPEMCKLLNATTH